jgi:hypothetical protein
MQTTISAWRLGALGLGAATLVALSTMVFLTSHASAQAKERTLPLAIRVAVFSPDQGSPEDYRSFIEGHLFPTVRSVPGYVGTFIGRDMTGGEGISVSFWRSEADAARGEEAVGQAIRSLPAGSAPHPLKVTKYVVQFRDIMGELSK